MFGPSFPLTDSGESTLSDGRDNLSPSGQIQSCPLGLNGTLRASDGVLTHPDRWEEGEDHESR